MSEQIGNNGYVAVSPETTRGVPATVPNTFVPLFKETMAIDAHLQAQQPIMGFKFATYQSLRGQRSHGGDLTVMAEPNTTKIFFNQLLSKISSTGTTPNTTNFGLSTASNPVSYTYDISLGGFVKRFFGVQISSIAPDYNDNELQWKLKVSALGSFQERSIASTTTTSAVLSTSYDPVPNFGLIVGDLVRLYNPANKQSLNTSVTAINTNGTGVTFADDVSAFGVGSSLVLRPANPSYAILDTFLWAKTIWGFGATATEALANATYALQTRVEQGSSWELSHPFENDEGSMRSGGFDPAALIRVAGDASLNVKKFLDTPEDVQKFNNMAKNSVVIRHLAGPNNEYELRVTFNNVKIDTPSGNLSFNDVTYQDIDLLVNQDAADGQAYGVTVISNSTV